MSLITPVKMKMQHNYIAIGIGIVAALILLSTSLFFLFNLYQADKFAQEKSTKFSSLINSKNFEQALSMYKDSNKNLSGTKKEKTIAKLNKVLTTNVDTFSNNLLKQKKDINELEITKGLSLFKDKISSELNTEFDRVYNLYLTKGISYTKASAYFKSMEAFSFKAGIIKKNEALVESLSNSRTSLSNAKKLMADKAYINAVVEFKKVTKADPADYQTAKDSILTCLNSAYPVYLKDAEDYKVKFQFRAACDLLKEALTYYPKDATIKQKITDYTAEEVKADSELVPYNGIVEHLFFHPLIAYPEKAFDGDFMSNGYNDWFVTVGEFNKIIQSLYDKNYILIDINSLYEDTMVNGKEVFKRSKLMLPKNKKPVIISVDDINYYQYMIDNGDVYKLVLDKDGNVETYSINPKGEVVYSRDNEIVPIIDKFVDLHPDFSFRGAKGTLGLTGYQGILGYRTQKLDDPNFETEKAGALKVIKRLKETGWNFASHSYGHPAMAKITYARVVKDTDLWVKEVESLIGPTKIYIYPFGSTVPANDPKFKYFYNAGFRVFCGVGARPYEKDTSEYIMMDRRDVDGYTLNYRRDTFLPLYDSNLIIDRSVRPAFQPLSTGKN